jgi:hypothetical protein
MVRIDSWFFALAQGLWENRHERPVTFCIHPLFTARLIPPIGTLGAEKVTVTKAGLTETTRLFGLVLVVPCFD